MDIEAQLKDLARSPISKIAAAKALNIQVDKLNEMLDILNIQWQKRYAGTYVIDGIKDTLEGHANRLDITVPALRYRLKKQKELTGEGFKPISEDDVRRFVKLRQQGMAAIKAAELVGRPYNSLKNAAKRMLEAPSDEEVRRFVKLREQGMNCFEAAERVGQPFRALNSAAKRMFPSYEDVLQKASRSDRSSKRAEREASLEFAA